MSYACSISHVHVGKLSGQNRGASGTRNIQSNMHGLNYSHLLFHEPCSQNHGWEQREFHALHQHPSMTAEAEIQFNVNK
jgi:hypothetical protein